MPRPTTNKPLVSTAIKPQGIPALSVWSTSAKRWARMRTASTSSAMAIIVHTTKEVELISFPLSSKYSPLGTSVKLTTMPQTQTNSRMSKNRSFWNKLLCFICISRIGSYHLYNTICSKLFYSTTNNRRFNWTSFNISRSRF